MPLNYTNALFRDNANLIRRRRQVGLAVKTSGAPAEYVPPVGVLSASANSRYLVDEGGSPVYLVGEAAWSLVAQLNNASIDTYLEDRASRGFNFILFNVLEHFFATNAPNNIDNVAPFTGTLFTTPNETYFARVDYAVTKAASLGMYVIMSPMYVGFNSMEGWQSEINAASTANITTWGTYIGNRYTGFYNVLWSIGGDDNPSGYMTKLNAFVTGLTTADPVHTLLTIHGSRGYLVSALITEPSWYSLRGVYSDVYNLPSLSQSEYAASPTKPFIHFEGRYENEISVTNLEVRSQAYWTFLNGACGFIFGNNPIWKFAYDTGGNWASSLGSEGSVAMGHLSTLIRSKNWSLLSPDTGHATLTAGYGTIGTGDYAPCARASDGSLVLIYMPSNRTMTVDMTRLSGTVTARWYDPTNGVYTADAASPLANSGTHNFSRSTANSAGSADWVLCLEV